MGIQHVITLIDSDLPTRTMSAQPVFDEAEIVVQLHDENELVISRLCRLVSGVIQSNR